MAIPFKYVKLEHEDLLKMALDDIAAGNIAKVQDCPFCGHPGLQNIKGFDSQGRKRIPWVGEKDGKLYVHRCQQMKDYWNNKMKEKH